MMVTRRTSWKLAAAGLPLLAVGWVVSCDDEGVAGPLSLTHFFAVAPGEDGEPIEVDLLAPPDGGTAALSPRSTFRAVFNQRLDGDKIEDVSSGSAAIAPGVATVTWQNAPGGARAIEVDVVFDPGGADEFFRAAPSLSIKPRAGLPSDAVLNLALDATRLVDKRGGAYMGPTALTAKTTPFTVEIVVPDPDALLAPDAPVAVRFSNLPRDGIAQFVSVVRASDNSSVPIVVVKDKADAASILVFGASGVAGGTDAGGGGTWTFGRHEIAISAVAADLFGVALMQSASAAFTVGIAGDGGQDGAAVDGGVAGLDSARADAALPVGGDAAIALPDAGLADSAALTPDAPAVTDANPADAAVD